MVNISAGDIFGQYTGEDAKRLYDTFHGSPQQDRNVSRFVQEVEQRLQGHLDDRLKAADAELQERADLLDDRGIELKGAAQKVKRGLGSGRLTAAEGRKEIARIATAQNELRERAEQLRNDDNALKEMAAMDPAEYEASYLATTPALRRNLPALSADYLNQP